jgi:hypothetical protein
MSFAQLRKKKSSTIHGKHHRDTETMPFTIRWRVCRLTYRRIPIFMHCLPRSPRPNRHKVPLILLSICHLWSFITLSIPSLWAAVGSFSFTHPGRAKSTRKYFEIWLGRAGDHTLSLRVSLFGFFAGSVDVGLKRHAHQIQSLELSFYTLALTRELDAMRAPFPSLKKLTVSPSTRPTVLCDS